MQINHSESCFPSPEVKYLITPWFGFYLLHLPLFLYVLHVGYKRRKNHNSASVNSHMDVITFHMVALELCSLVFTCLYYSGFYSGPSSLSNVGASSLYLCFMGQALFHSLTCVDRYLAVVQPITYLRLKKRGGVTIRNVTIGCIWLFSLGNTSVINGETMKSLYSLVTSFMITVLSLTVTGFCSVSVICVLIRPGPGERGGDGRILCQSKRFALETVVAILAVLVLRFLAFFIQTGMFMALSLTTLVCCIIAGGLWFSLPSSLVLPLLFLHRAGKLTGLKKKKPIVRPPSDRKVQRLNATTATA